MDTTHKKTRIPTIAKDGKGKDHTEEANPGSVIGKKPRATEITAHWHKERECCVEGTERGP